jgi:hypothetical protein
VGINIAMEEAPASPPTAATGIMPAETELIEMAHRSVSLLANAVARDDSTDLCQTQISPTSKS